MKNLAKLKPLRSISFNDGQEKIILTEGDTVLIITDGTEFDKKHSGEITFINEDIIELNNSNKHISWEYILEINHL